ncbi:MAG: hypothetical protein JNM90_09625 [Burkholderiales bacterium]|nr:hypothetical protein [Burkholderiales bacterium]
MSLFKWMLLAFWAGVQGMAPLLHVHLGRDDPGVRGVHVHLAAPGAAAAAAASVPEAHAIESAIMGLGQEIRRDVRIACTDAAPPRVAASVAPRTHVVASAFPAPPATTVPRRAFLLPPAQAPPLIG